MRELFIGDQNGEYYKIIDNILNFNKKDEIIKKIIDKSYILNDFFVKKLDKKWEKNIKENYYAYNRDSILKIF